MGKDDVDGLEGQALVDAVAVEVMGLERHEDEFGDAWWCEVRPDGEVVGKFRVDDWHPESSWPGFGAVVDRLRILGFGVAFTVGGPTSECVVYECIAMPTPHGVVAYLSDEPLVRQLGKENLFETGCRAALKAVRARRVVP